jgi:hypothetical protein
VSVLALGLMLLPGLAAWAWLGKRGRDPIVALAQIIGFSLAGIALLTEWVFVLGGSFSPFGIGLLLAGMAALAIYGLIRRKPQFDKQQLWQLLIGLALFGGLIAWRLYQVRDLHLPNWVDSQHHYLIIRVMLEQRGLPMTLAPFLDQPFYYHFSFHAATALFTALSGLPIGEAMLLFGQIMNAAIALSVYALGKTLWKDWKPALAAALLVGWVTRMPAYYASWGRYTLTVGMLLLPLAMAAALRALRKPGDKKALFSLALLTGGILLSHYFAALLLALFLVILLTLHFLPRLKTLLTALVSSRSVWLGGSLGLLAALPWVWRMLRLSSLSAGLQSNLPTSSSALEAASGNAAYIWKLLGPTSNYWLLLPAGLGLVWACIKRKRITFGLWTVICALLALPWSVALRPFRPDHFAIILFLPLAIWAGWAIWQLGEWLAKALKRHWLALAIPGLLVGGWIICSFDFGAHIINSATTLVTEADVDALEWVRENTPEDARFLINTTYWLSNNYRGVDGGGWLLPYTGRWAVVPTVFYGFSPDKTAIGQLIDWGQAANSLTTCDENFWELVHDADLDWIYIREGNGGLQTEGLEGCESLMEAYKNESVYIYQILN